jgi:hypothetical protein
MVDKTTSQAQTAQSTAIDTTQQRVIAFAEHVGRLVGSVQAKTDGWMDRHALHEQLTKIRDGAADLLGHLGGSPSSRSLPPKRMSNTTGRARKVKTTPRFAATNARSDRRVDAPGITHRRAPADTRSVKHSDEMIPKANAARQRRHDRRRR